MFSQEFVTEEQRKEYEEFLNNHPYNNREFLTEKQIKEMPKQEVVMLELKYMLLGILWLYLLWVKSLK